MSKCKPGDVPAEAVEEYAKALCDAFGSAPPDCGYRWSNASAEHREGQRAAARRAISDGACPEGWEWRASESCRDGREHLMRKAPAPKPDPAALAKASDGLLNDLYAAVGSNHAPGDMPYAAESTFRAMAAALRAIVAEMRARS